MPQMPSFDSVHQESTNSIAAENSSVGSIMEVTDENLEQISDVIGKKSKGIPPSTKHELESNSRR